MKYSPVNILRIAASEPDRGKDGIGVEVHKELELVPAAVKF